MVVAHFVLMLAASILPQNASIPASARADSIDVIDKCIEHEHKLIKFLGSRDPVAETYVQDTTHDSELGVVPIQDHYFLGRASMGEIPGRDDYFRQGLFKRVIVKNFNRLYKAEYLPSGFASMAYPDRSGFDRAHYTFHYVRREFLGDIRCLLFDVSPRRDTGSGRFIGRIWVEDQEFQIVRFSGKFIPTRDKVYFHFDSWRLNLTPGYWIPAYIYSEENDFYVGVRNKVSFKAQTRIWGYAPKIESKGQERAEIHADAINDESRSEQDDSPLQAERDWQQQAADNVLDRLTKGALLAPEGDVDQVLETVANNIVITNKVELQRPLHARLLLTTPLESFSIGDAIVVSRGLLDVLPDEAALAAILSRQIAHIILGHNIGRQYVFTDRLMFDDDRTYDFLRLRYSKEEEAEADDKAIELLKNSPYAKQMKSITIFFQAVRDHTNNIKELLNTHLGNSLIENGSLSRMASVSDKVVVSNSSLVDIAERPALPLGSRIKVNPWNDVAEISKTAPTTILSVHDWMPFQVTPIHPWLKRLGANTEKTAVVSTSR